MKPLYLTKKVVWLTYNKGPTNMNLGWGDTDFILYKTYSGTVHMDFVIRDIDRKPVKLNGKKLRLTFIDDNTNEFIHDGYAEILDPVRGRARYTFPPDVLNSFPSGKYRYVAELVDSLTGEETVLAGDLNWNAINYVEIRDETMPKPLQPTILTDATPVRVGSETWFLFSSFRGAARKFGSSITTIVFYLTNFWGEIWLETTLDPVPDPDDSRWSPYRLTPSSDRIQYRGFTGLDPYNVEGEYQWLRVWYRFDNPPNVDGGSVDKVIAL